MQRKTTPVLDVEAIVQDYEAFRRNAVGLRGRGKSDEARRLVETFNQKQCLRATRAVEKSNPEDARVLLVVLALQLSDEMALPFDVRKYLSNALIQAAKTPEKAGAALGLVRKNRRPRSTEYRDITIAFRILELSALHPINASASDSAIVTAAREHKVSVDVAEHAWKRHARFVKGWQRAMQKKSAQGERSRDS